MKLRDGNMDLRRFRSGLLRGMLGINQTG